MTDTEKTEETSGREADSITRVKLSDKEIILVGTAHISKESVREVEETIRRENPDQVCVEIDASRYKSLADGQSWSNLNITQVLKSGQGFLLLANMVLSSFQKRMGLDQGASPGDEMKAAINVCKELNIPYIFADREIQVTLRRAWKKSSFWQKIKLLSALLASFFSREKLSEEEIEKMKKKSAMDEMMGELADYLPAVKTILVDERDQYLATSIYKAPGSKVIAVIGAAHAPGIVRWLEALEKKEKSDDLTEISLVPSPGKASKILPWIIPVIVLGLLAFGFFRGGRDVGLQMVWAWILSNGVLAALGALIALAHPLTIIISFLAAPITSMNPTIGVGVVTGLIEYYVRKPRVKDFENLNKDMSSIKGFYKNRVTHIFLVFFLSSLGSSIGTFVALPYILRAIG